MTQCSQRETWNTLELLRKVWASRKLVLKACGIGAIVGIVVVLGTPKEYTASTLITPERTRRSSSLEMSMLSDINMSSSPITERDAIFPSLYPTIVNSTPFLIRLFDIKVREQKDSTAMPLSQYLMERQKRPWWRVITSAPSKLVGRVVSLFSSKPDEDGEKVKAKSGINPFRLTRKEAGMAGAIASRINIEIDRKKRTLTIFVTMQDPLVAAAVADTVQAYLKEYVTEYRTAKASRTLEYTKKLRQEAQAAYYEAQEKYTRYADTNQGLVRLASRAELARLRNEMDLALVIYNQTEQQVQAAKTKLEKVRPVYAVIQPVTVPLRASKPRRMMILAGCILLSGAGSVTWILFRRGFERS